MNAVAEPQERASSPSPVQARAGALRRRRAAIVRTTILLALAAALMAWASQWIRTMFLHVHETDARITADMVSVSSPVDGRLVRRPVDAGSKVARGDTIAIIDDRDARARLVELEAGLDRLEGERAELQAKLAMVARRGRSRVEGERAKLDAAMALVEAIEHEFAYAEREFRRTEKLSAQKVVAERALDEARTAYLTTQKELVGARAAVATAGAELAIAEAERDAERVLERELASLELEEAELTARFDRQVIDIEDRTVTSPLDGVISKAFVEAGEYVEAGQRIVLLHDPGAVYVEANIRETEIRRVRVGQRVRVEVDAYPERTFAGQVELIGQAATSEFALLPNPNPSGHFTKVTQRLPVRVALDQEAGLLRPGMMVEIYIDVDRE